MYCTICTSWMIAFPESSSPPSCLIFLAYPSTSLAFMAISSIGEVRATDTTDSKVLSFRQWGAYTTYTRDNLCYNAS